MKKKTDEKETKEILKKLRQLEKQLQQLEDGELYLVSSINEEYDDWYSSI